MRRLKLTIARTPFLGYAILLVFRANLAIGYFKKPILNLLRWLLKSKETTNFTFDLEDRNKRHLASLIADVANIEFDVVTQYLEEVEQDEILKKHISDATAKSDWQFIADKEARFGRRVGWYAFVRALKPRVVVETGVDKGLGACVLASALKRNKEEGYEGKYYGTDIKPKAGYLLSGDYAGFGTILYGDSIESLKELDCMIDLFINDSDHSADYEAMEYEVVANKLSEHAIILGDNADFTDALLNFSLKMSRHFVFFKEKPFEHWHPGAGIGISFNR
ncbi:MAG: class I SAM-dependent methyltransferase [Cyanobacteria bacterium P01_A01_bin.123]